jgi:uncharacterized cupredoxin-like copper-binding protein
MNTSIVRLVMAALVALFVVAACAGQSGAQWTFAPVAVASQASGEASTTGEATAGAASEPAAASAVAVAPAAESMAPMTAESAAPATESAVPGEPVAPSGEARVIELVATGALQFTDPAGTQVRDIPVTPGETITFRVDNTAGFDHNFYIGTDEQLIVPAGTTDVGIATWQTGVQELTWVVPADITGLKFGCTVPGHYALMQGTFSVAA